MTAEQVKSEVFRFVISYYKRKWISAAAPSFLAGDFYLCLNDIIAFPPARVLPDGKTRIRHLARVGLLPASCGGHTKRYTINDA